MYNGETITTVCLFDLKLAINQKQKYVWKSLENSKLEPIKTRLFTENFGV